MNGVRTGGQMKRMRDQKLRAIKSSDFLCALDINTPSGADLWNREPVKWRRNSWERTSTQFEGERDKEEKDGSPESRVESKFDDQVKSSGLARQWRWRKAKEPLDSIQ